MKKYISIPGLYGINKSVEVYLFPKYDGSCMRVEWNKKRGFYKFGSKNKLLTTDSGILNKAIDIINKNDIDKRLLDKRYSRAMLFFEFFGTNSFAGYHVDHVDEKHVCVLFDVAPHRVGILPPSQFIELTDGIDAAKPIYHGVITDEIIEKIRAGKLEGQTFEGVVAKSDLTDKNRQPIMFKIKNDRWIERVKEKCGGDNKMFKKLI